MRNNITKIILMKGTKVLLHTTNGEKNIIADKDVIYDVGDLKYDMVWAIHNFSAPYPIYETYKVYSIEWEH